LMNKKRLVTGGARTTLGGGMRCAFPANAGVVATATRTSVRRALAAARRILRERRPSPRAAHPRSSSAFQLTKTAHSAFTSFQPQRRGAGRPSIRERVYFG
jgi:hypothetical protein